MGNWSKKFSKVLTAAGISAIIAVSSIALPIEAFAARTVTDNVMIRNEPSTEGGIIGSLNEGDEVTILDVMQSGDGYPWTESSLRLLSAEATDRWNCCRRRESGSRMKHMWTWRVTGFPSCPVFPRSRSGTDKQDGER